MLSLWNKPRRSQKRSFESSPYDIFLQCFKNIIMFLKIPFLKFKRIFKFVCALNQCLVTRSAVNNFSKYFFLLPSLFPVVAFYTGRDQSSGFFYFICLLTYYFRNLSYKNTVRWTLIWLACVLWCTVTGAPCLMVTEMRSPNNPRIAWFYSYDIGDLVIMRVGRKLNLR